MKKAQFLQTNLIKTASYQNTIIRSTLALFITIFTIETINNPGSPQTLLSAFANLKSWLFPSITNFEQLPQVAQLVSFSIALTLFIGIFTRLIGVFLALIFLLAIINEPFLWSQPLISLTKTSVNLTLIGAAISLAINGPGALSLSALFRRPKLIHLAEFTKNRPYVAQNIVRFTLAATLILITASAFYWSNENNIFWSYYFQSISKEIDFISPPVLTSILGTASILLLFRIATKGVCLIISFIFLVIVSLNGLSGYIFLSIIGCALSQIAAEEDNEISDFIREQIEEQAEEQKSSIPPKPKPQKKASKKGQNKKPKTTKSKSKKI